MPINFTPSEEFDQIIEATAKEKYSCPICQEPMIEAISTSCNHKFCNFCLSQWLKNYEQCPLCKSEVTTTARRPKVDKKLSELYKLGTVDLRSDRDMCINYRKLHQMKAGLGAEDDENIAEQIKVRAAALMDSMNRQTKVSRKAQIQNHVDHKQEEEDTPWKRTDFLSSLFGGSSWKEVSDKLFPLQVQLAAPRPARHYSSV